MKKKKHEKKYDFLKIRKMLRNDYHLCVEHKEDGKIGWSLYRNYIDSRVYFSKDNKAILTSKTNTYEELYKYAKEHRKYDLDRMLGITMIIVSCILVILSIVNIFIGNICLRGFLFGANTIIIAVSIISFNVFNKNSNVEFLELKENLERLENENI